MACNTLKTVLATFSLSLLASCSRGGLYDGDEKRYSGDNVIEAEKSSSETSLGLTGSYSSLNRLFIGAGSGYDDIMVFSPPYGFEESSNGLEVDSEATDKTLGEVSRYLVRHREGLNLQKAILQPQNSFDPILGAECVLTLKGMLQNEDQCEGASICRLYRVDNIYTNEESDKCNFPTIKSFVVKFSNNVQTAEVLEPGTESWIQTNQINYFDTKSSAIRISAETDLFSSVVATTSTNGYVFAGKRHLSETISASFPDQIGTTPIIKANLEGVSTRNFYEKGQTRNVLLVVTTSGIFKLNSKNKWESVAMPPQLPALPPGLGNASVASGVGMAAFRLTFAEGGTEKSLLLVYKEATNTLEVVDHSDIALEQGVPADKIPSGWSMMIVNESLWFWNPLSPTLGKKFDEKEKKWVPISFVLPVMEETETSLKYLISPAGEGFVVTLGYKEGVYFQRSDVEQTFYKDAYRHFYYDKNGEQVGKPISTFSAPNAMHVLNGKMYFERVVGVNSSGADTVMDYGYVYDFAKNAGRMFSDRGFNAANADRDKEYLSKFSGILVNDQSVLFYGGCESPVDIQQCLSAAQSSSSSCQIYVSVTVCPNFSSSSVCKI